MSTPENVLWNNRRDARSHAVREMNRLAATIGAEAILARSSAAQVQVLYENLCGHLDGVALDELILARNEWVDNGGGGDLRSEFLQDRRLQDDEDCTQSSGLLPSPKVLQESFYASRKPFSIARPCVMLTLNSMTFTLCFDLWTSFSTWVKKKAIEFNASEWSATLEDFLRADEKGRVRLHAYFSWTRAGQTGIDHRTTDAWVFQNVRPRVDVNTEARGPHE